MELARFLHGSADARTAGQTLTHGRAYEAFGNVLFGGRRRQVFTRLARLSGARPGDRALDVGCGTGYLTLCVADAVTPAGSVLGIDPSPDVLTHARRRADRRPHCTFADGIAENLPGPDGGYDVVVSSLMIHHLPEHVRARSVAEMHRVLRPGGRLLLADFRPPANPVARHLIGAVTGPVMEHNPVHLLEPLVRDAGFTQIETGDLHPWIHHVRATKPGRPE
ncbi:methyltransferase domain-containing protein [Streptomyces sp. CB01881]|uniref:class I SAM-dependent methyltransferase n=1 Tax=Streptomyces sp. CB01881 TaxID=2078691 RepID=UPI000CDBFB5F|nr:methyltransferase domain-containing protein [Streptomyces sp. CB01881]AUY53433.1 methyltransferase [Streptomyces sp. CB01881]TYC69585.1 methyltransferase domain-containing protein [Streptomyces sp. CB01881]